MYGTVFFSVFYQVFIGLVVSRHPHFIVFDATLIQAAISCISRAAAATTCLTLTRVSLYVGIYMLSKLRQRVLLVAMRKGVRKLVLHYLL